MVNLKSVSAGLCLILIQCLNAQDHAAEVALRATGRVLLTDNETRIGTAFVAGETHNIFLPAHVAVNDTLLFKPYKSEYSFRIIPKYILAEFDLAIYERTGGEQAETYPLGDLERLLPGDQVAYLGWESDRKINIHLSKIAAKGQTIHKSEIVDFIDLIGPGVKGYSGGPVFNIKGEVVAMIVQGWDVVPFGAKTPIRVMRAYSVDLLRILEQRLSDFGTPDSMAQEEQLRLIDLIEEK